MMAPLMVIMTGFGFENENAVYGAIIVGCLLNAAGYRPLYFTGALIADMAL